MTARKMMALRWSGLVAVAAMIPALLTAQTNSRPPEKDAALLMVPTFKSADKTEKNNVGLEAAEAFRSKVNSEISTKQIYVVPIQKVNAQLEASGFPLYEGMQASDAKQLATYVRADYFIAGTAVKSPTGVKIGGDLVLTRNVTLRQPLGTFEAPKVDAATELMAKELKEALKQMDGEKKCTNAAREKKYPEAIAAADAAIALYPKATLARICLASVLEASGAPPAEVLKITREVTKIDPHSNPALQLQASAFRNLKQSDSLVATLTNLLATEPDPAQQSVIITEIAGETNPAVARPIIEAAIVANPDDSELLKLRWLILSAVKDYKAMFAQGAELAALDTAFADSVYFRRTALAYVADSQPLKAAEIAGRGVAKYPTNEVLTGLEIQQLQKAGQQQQALEKLDRAVAKKVAVENAGAIRLGLLRDLGRNSDILPTIKSMIAAGDTTSALRANLFAQLAADSKAQLIAATSLPDTIAAYRKSLEMLMYADTVIKSGPQVAETQFRIGNAQLLLGGQLLTQAGRLQANRAQACPIAREAKDHLTEAQILLPKGGSYSAELTGKLMTALMGISPQADQMVTAFCGK
ncbi:MAG: hypothetical protein ABJC26_13310 [Gemmatimonadaceae bacterium]